MADAGNGENMPIKVPKPVKDPAILSRVLNLKRNHVYFMKNFRENDGDLCIYDLDEQTLDIVRVHDRDLDLKSTKPFWIRTFNVN
uniref:DUF295 domain-containing protein n=2 Tax=Oryza TaxID=4527 RepID=A0A0D3EXW5_9ORYZ